MPAQITFEVQGMDELVQRMNQSSTRVKISLNEGLRQIGRLIVPTGGTGPLAAETPVKTGKLRRSTVFQILGAPGNQSLEVRQAARSESGDFYGFFVREGTPPHEIRPKTKQSLRFMIGDRVIFSKLVRHPGTKANPYHVRVLTRLMPRVQNIINEMGVRVTAFLSGR